VPRGVHGTSLEDDLLSWEGGRWSRRQAEQNWRNQAIAVFMFFMKEVQNSSDPILSSSIPFGTISPDSP
jgi:hypothetical protein